MDIPAAQVLSAISNLALGRKARQSSVSEWSVDQNIERDAARAVNGQIDGTKKFHTSFEDNPWWQVDLGGFATIMEIRVYNTNDHTAFRCRNISLSVSIDGEAWVELIRKEDNEVVGGISNVPFAWNGPGTAWARFVRVTLLGRDYLHLDQVEVFGRLN